MAGRLRLSAHNESHGILFTGSIGGPWCPAGAVVRRAFRLVFLVPAPLAMAALGSPSTSLAASSSLFSPLKVTRVDRPWTLLATISICWRQTQREDLKTEDLKASHMSFMRHTGTLPRELCFQLPHHVISKGHSYQHDGRFPLLSNAFLGPPRRFRGGRGMSCCSGQ